MTVAGREEPLEVYEVLCLADEESDDGIADEVFTLRAVGMACRVFTSGGGGGVNRAPPKLGGGVGKRAQLTDNILTNEKVRIHVFQEAEGL